MTATPIKNQRRFSPRTSWDALPPRPAPRAQARCLRTAPKAQVHLPLAPTAPVRFLRTAPKAPDYLGQPCSCPPVTCFTAVIAIFSRARRRKRPLESRRNFEIGGGPAVFPPSPRLTYQPACKPGSVRPAGLTANVTAIPLVRRLPGASSNLPERLARTDLKLALQRRSYSVLLPVGFAVPFPSLETRCALTAPFHPCRGQNTTQPWRSVLCGTVPRV
jgi:hypothetical protein